MMLPFDTSEQIIIEFENVLKENGLTIKKDSDLDKVCFAVLETNAKYKKELVHDNNLDIRDILSDVAGIVDFVSMIVKHKNHKDFNQLIPHLHLLNKASTTVLTKKSKVTDEGNNKLLELYIALLCMSFAENIELDHPENSKGDNPDIMFTYNGVKWGIACKALHTENEKTLYNTIEKGTDQIEKSSAQCGIVLVNFKNIVKKDEMWPIFNEIEFSNGEEPLFGSFSSVEYPLYMLAKYGLDYQEKLITTFDIKDLLKLTETGKCPPGFLIFLQSMTSFVENGYPITTHLKMFNFVKFANIPSHYVEIAFKLNEAMHSKL